MVRGVLRLGVFGLVGGECLRCALLLLHQVMCCLSASPAVGEVAPSPYCCRAVVVSAGLVIFLYACVS